MRSPGIRVRLTAWYTIILAFSLCAFGGVAYVVIRQSIRAAMNEGLRQRLEGIQKILNDDVPQGPDALDDELREYADGLGKTWLLRVADSSGNVYFASRGLEKPLESTNRKHPSYPFQAGVGDDYYQVLRRSLVAGGNQYDVILAVSLHDFIWALGRFRLTLFALVPAFLLLASLGGYWMSRSALSPVDEITHAARSIGVRELSRRVAVPQTGDELQRLADTLNGMLARLETAFHRITQFTADASHELRTPVSVMRTSAELTLRKHRSEPEYREALAEILRESEKISQLIEQLLILARADSAAASVPLVPTDLSQILHAACGQASQLAEAKGLALSERLPDHPLWVRGDASSLERLFVILLDNAVKYTPSGGRIEVELFTNNGDALAEFRDTGIGMSADDIPRVFDRFYRADRARSRESGGTGLGLAIGRWITDVHGGEIRLRSEPFMGSTFQVRLPLLRQ